MDMIEIRKTDNFAKWLDDLNDIRARASWYELNDWQQEIPGMLNLLVRGYQSCGSIMGQVIAFITKRKLEQ
jgi:hypothetical protein